MNRKFLISAMAIRPAYLLMSCIFVTCLPVFCGTVIADSSEIMATVDSTIITDRDISYMIDIEKAYGNNEITQEAVIVSLINDAIEHKVARLYDVFISQGEIDSFKRHVDEHTKAPHVLQQVKLLFGDDSSSYNRIYLAPKITSWRLHDFYSASHEIHKRERELIERAYGLVVAGRGFRKAAEECGLRFSSFAVEDKETVQPLELGRYAVQNNPPVKGPLIPILESLTPGEIYRNIVEDDYGYRVIRLRERNSETYSVEAIAVNKEPFDEWFRKQATRVGIEILDQDLKDRIKAKYPDIWWLKKLSKE